MASETGRMSVAVPSDTQEKLDAIAAKEDRSRNWLVNQAINQYLDLYEWQTMRIQERLEHARSGKANFSSSKDIDELIENFKV